MANIIGGGTGIGEEAVCESLAIANEPEQQVFGIKACRSELTCLLAREDQDALRLLATMSNPTNAPDAPASVPELYLKWWSGPRQQPEP